MPKLQVLFPKSFADCQVACEDLPPAPRRACRDAFMAAHGVFVALRGLDVGDNALDAASLALNGPERGRVPPRALGSFLQGVVLHQRFGKIKGLDDDDAQGYFGLYQVAHLKNAVLFVATEVPDPRVVPLRTGKPLDMRRSFNSLVKSASAAQAVVDAARRLRP